MHIKESITLTQDRWLKLFKISAMGRDASSCGKCGFCVYTSMKRIKFPTVACEGCPVLRVYGKTCREIPSYVAWRNATSRSEAEANAIRWVIGDLNTIATYFHAAKVEVPE